jgi:hypothetical protein
MLEAVTLDPPELPVSLEHQVPAALRQIPERELTLQALPLRAPAA